MAQAETLASQLARESPNSAAALDLNARVRFYQGRYEEAVRLLEQALAIETANERLQALRILTQQTLDTVKKLKRFESAHFILHADEDKDGILVPPALDALEKSYQVIGQALGYYPENKVRVEIAPNAASFNAISTLSLRDIEETGAVGLCKFNKIMTISPRALIQGYRWLDSLSHEYLHYVIVGLSANKAPIWLHEGMARFYETRWRRLHPPREREDYLTASNQTLLSQALERNKFIGFKRMEPSLIYLESPEEVQLAYAEAASAIDFMVERKGHAGMRELLSELQKRPTQEAIEKVLESPYAVFETQWKDFLKAKGLKEIEGSRVRRLKVKENQKEDEESVELKEIQSVVARNRTHLADQLLGRGRMAAAAQEYRRALQASPHSPIILNKLARTLIRGGKHEEALPHLKKAQELDPDSVSTYIQLGRLYHAAKNFSAARDALEEAIQINPFDPTIYRLLSEIYAALGERDGAERAKITLDRLMSAR
ncbi:MAG: tetratricopeptide repeat protein [Deltaproteobacteria bacterium]|nr:tetratricopeptide repeat protein [Deltaproteobacteria bacterium]